MIEVLIGAAALGGFLGVCIALFGMTQVHAMASPRSRLEPIDLESEQCELDELGNYIAWAEESGFDWIDAYRGIFPGSAIKPIVLAWEDAAGTVFAAYKIGAITVCDLLTTFDGLGASTVTTTRTQTGQPQPIRPGSFIQVFSSISLDELHRKHSDAVTFLEARYGKRRTHRSVPFDEFFLSIVRDQARSIRNIRLWPARQLYWELRKRRYVNVPVHEKYAIMTASSTSGSSNA